MKVILIVLSILLSQTSFSMENGLDFKDNFEVEQVVMDEILINNLIKLYNDYDFESSRMIAGEFDGIEKKMAKKNYLDGLRTKLEGSKGLSRF